MTKQAFCVKCRKMVIMKNPIVKTIKGKRILLDVCPICGTKIGRFLPKEFSSQ